MIIEFLQFLSFIFLDIIEIMGSMSTVVGD